MAAHFETVRGYDTSANQIKHAKENNSFSNIIYDIADGHTIPVNGNSVDLVTCSQSFHWLDTKTFYLELKRILKKNGVVALITYEMPFLTLSPTKSLNGMNNNDVVRQLIRNFYGHSKIKSYWASKERYLVDTAYKSVVLPYPNQIRVDDTLINEGVSAADIIGYIYSWSAFQALKDKDPRVANEFIDEFNAIAKDICGDLKVNCFNLEFRFHLIMARNT